ncbi:MAG: hypothetical protein V8Q32_01005 [Anaerotignum faecicola]
MNTLKTNTQALKKKLEQAGVHVAEGRICADALHLTKTADLSRLDAFKEGLFHVQDESSQLAVRVLDPKKGEEDFRHVRRAGREKLYDCGTDGKRGQSAFLRYLCA